MTPDTYISSGILELYVAGVLAEEDRARVEAMAADNPTVHEEIKRIERTITGYASLFTPESFNAASIYGNISQKLAEPLPQPEEPQPVHHGKAKQKVKPQPKAAAAPVSDHTAEVKTESRERKTSAEAPRKSFAGAFAFTLLLLILSLLGNFYLYNDWLETRNAYNDIHQQNIKLAEQNSNTQPEAFSGHAIYADTDVKIINLAPADSGNGGLVRVFWNSKTKQLKAMPLQLNAAPQGKAYQLWAVDNEGKAVDAGLLQINADTVALQNMKLVESATKFAVTVEPESGNTQPSSPAIYESGTFK